MEKKEWSEPVLTVLVRSRPEEAVLSACKIAGLNLGANNSNDGCMYDQYHCFDGCSAIGTS